MMFLIDNITDRFSLHSVESGHLICSYPTKPTVAKVKQVAFGEKRAIVIGGGDQGLVYIFYRKQSNQLQCLQHGKEGMVQMIAVHNVETHTTIIAATSRNLPNPSISIWKHKHHKPENSSTMSKQAEAQHAIHTLNTIFTMVFLAVLMVLLINAAVHDRSPHIDASKRKQGWQINWQNGTAADIIAALFPSTKGEDPSLMAVRAEWERVKEEVTKYQATWWEMKADATEAASSMKYDGSPATPRTSTRSGRGLSRGDNGSGGRDQRRATEVEAAAGSIIFI
ncbi:hypothetical protein JVT61DRAFT_3905 [Boletus reticuloceps]|uniref:Uncharacterized protein n=1 Tax=Boletus reticuloceps TaxID=495285 RepID=A0A8I3A7D5_9AGAM|nr:hypothetical protein JVT61DRAFT_3905 [Boletus reticuloceps]